MTDRVSYIPDLIVRKVEGPEKGCLGSADLTFHEREFGRLVKELEGAFEQSSLPEGASGSAAMNDLLVRIRLK